VSAKSAQRRNVRQAHHIGARSAAYGTLLVTLQASIKIHGGACIAFVCRVMQKSNVFFARQSTTKEHFSHVAWQTRDPKRRLCLQCQTKTRGSWKCAVCHQPRSRHHFSSFISRRPSRREDGTQTCNTCHAAKVQRAVRKRAAASSAARLEPLRKRLRHRQIIQETWEAIAQKRSRTTIPVEKCVENTAEPTISQRKPVYEYICPHCETQVRSTVTDGQVDAKQQHCGVRFRVRGGTVTQNFHSSLFKEFLLI